MLCYNRTIKTGCLGGGIKEFVLGEVVVCEERQLHSFGLNYYDIYLKSMHNRLVP